MTNSWTTDDILLAFIREFSALGQVSSSVTREGQREQIRVAIFRNQRQSLQFYDSGLTYTEAYTKVYGASPELRRTPRNPPEPMQFWSQNKDEDEDDEDIVPDEP
jgi:hypothetical protein